MPSLPGSLTLPGPLVVVLILGLVILAMAATMVSALRRGGRHPSGNWGAALNGARERQQRQSAEMEALHRAVTDLAADKDAPDQPHE